MVLNLEPDLQKKVVINTLVSNVTFRVSFLLFLNVLIVRLMLTFIISSKCIRKFKTVPDYCIYTFDDLNKANTVSRICNGFTNTYHNIRTRNSGSLGTDLSFYNITYTMTILISYLSQVSFFETFILCTLKCNE